MPSPAAPSAFRLLVAGRNASSDGRDVVLDAEALADVLSLSPFRVPVVAGGHSGPVAGLCTLEDRDGALWATRCTWQLDAARGFAAGAWTGFSVDMTYRAIGDACRPRRIAHVALLGAVFPAAVAAQKNKDPNMHVTVESLVALQVPEAIARNAVRSLRGVDGARAREAIEALAATFAPGAASSSPAASRPEPAQRAGDVDLARCARLAGVSPEQLAAHARELAADDAAADERARRGGGETPEELAARHAGVDLETFRRANAQLNGTPQRRGYSAEVLVSLGSKAKGARLDDDGDGSAADDDGGAEEMTDEEVRAFATARRLSPTIGRAKFLAMHRELAARDAAERG